MCVADMQATREAAAFKAKYNKLAFPVN